MNEHKSRSAVSMDIYPLYSKVLTQMLGTLLKGELSNPSQIMPIKRCHRDLKYVRDCPCLFLKSSAVLKMFTLQRIYIPLPEAPARSHMFKVHLGDTPNSLTSQDFDELGRRTQGFSGSDVNVVVKDVLFEPVRKTQEATHFRSISLPSILLRRLKSELLTTTLRLLICQNT